MSRKFYVVVYRTTYTETLEGTHIGLYSQPPVMVAPNFYLGPFDAHIFAAEASRNLWIGEYPPNVPAQATAYNETSHGQ